MLDAHLTRIARYNPALNAIVTHNEENARAGAREADAALARGEVWGPLHGVPVTIKDSFATAGLRTTSGFPPLTNHIPDSDATAVARLRAAGAIVLGKTNLPLLVHGFQSDNPIFGRTNNPWDHARTPGSSTGGGAAAIAAGLSPLELGSDYGGSVRIPAHFCGIYSLKPTNNRIPLTGHIPELPGRRSVRHVATPGPLARCVQDLVLALQVMAGPDPYHPDVPPLPLTRSGTCVEGSTRRLGRGFWRNTGDPRHTGGTDEIGCSAAGTGMYRCPTHARQHRFPGNLGNVRRVAPV